MSKTDNLQLEIPSAADKHIFTTYKNNNEIIDEAYGQYLEDQETSQENIAMIESSTAQSNHAVGSYFMLDNVLHKASLAIASGETITSGSNATPITIEEALTALNTSVNSLRDLVSLNSLLKVNWIRTTDLNTYTPSYLSGLGVRIHVAIYTSTTTNKPSGSDAGYAVVFAWDTLLFGTQLLIDQDKSKLFIRRYNNGTWESWKSLAFS